MPSPKKVARGDNFPICNIVKHFWILSWPKMSSELRSKSSTVASPLEQIWVRFPAPRFVWWDGIVCCLWWLSQLRTPRTLQIQKNIWVRQKSGMKDHRWFEIDTSFSCLEIHRSFSKRSWFFFIMKSVLRVCKVYKFSLPHQLDTSQNYSKATGSSMGAFSRFFMTMSLFGISRI